jgi:chitin-binding protein
VNTIYLVLALALTSTPKAQPVRKHATYSKVQLAWQAPTPNGDDVIGYHVYRLNNGVFAYLATADALTYTDANVVHGTTYTYVVRSIDAAGNESADSNAVTITFP